jgi:hypothetical protein
MSNFIVEDGFDASESRGSYIPAGAIIMSAKTYTVGEAIQTDRCPCDGRALNTYTYRNLHKVISNNFGGTAYSAGVTDQPGAVTTFNVPALMPVSGSTLYGDTRDQRYIAGSNTPAALTSTLTTASHTHNITGILSPTGVLNNVVDSHTHTIATRTHTTTVNDNNHTFSSPSQNLGDSAGQSQRNDGNSISSGLSHQHNVNSTTTRSISPGTTAVPNHTHTSYTAADTSTAASKPAHSHSAAAVTSQSISDYDGPSYIRVVYYIKL